MKALRMALVAWVVLAALATALCVGMYAVGQQVLRQSINDVPVQLAEDAASRLCGSCETADPKTLAPQALVEIQDSLSPWLMVYDSSGKPVTGNAIYNGSYPVLPAGIFSNIDFWRHGHSWQPDPSTRQALVVIRAADGEYVAAGRNMREMERHIEHLGALMFVGWLATLGMTLVLCLGAWFILKGDALGR